MRSKNVCCIQPTENRWPINIPKWGSVTHRGRICLIICEQYVTLFWRIVRRIYIQVFCEGWKRKHYFTHYLSDNMWTWLKHYASCTMLFYAFSIFITPWKKNPNKIKACVFFHSWQWSVVHVLNHIETILKPDCDWRMLISTVGVFS